MNRYTVIFYISVVLVLLVSCSSAAVIPTSTPQVAQGQTPQTTQMTTPYPLAEYGTYYAGKTALVADDASRDKRQVRITVWYPAVQPDDPQNRSPSRDAPPDTSGKPYPIILSSTKVADIIAPHLVSHGFAWASIDGIDSYYAMDKEMTDQPLDILFALNLIATNPLKSLEGLIDVDHAGAIGYSFDGYNTLAVSGARIDPEYYLAQCPNPDTTTEAILSGLSSFSCYPADEWEQFTAHIDQAITASEDGLWQPMTDERIRAVMPMAGEGWWLFGAKGLAAVDRPTLIIVATEDPLYRENALIFDKLGTLEKALISFVGQDHFMIFDSEMVARMTHFAVAFFGYHLQGREDLAWYFSEDFVARHDGLAWGVVVKE